VGIDVIADQFPSIDALVSRLSGAVAERPENVRKLGMDIVTSEEMGRSAVIFGSSTSIAGSTSCRPQPGGGAYR